MRLQTICALGGLLLAPSAMAQADGGFQTPGQPVRTYSGQTDRFSSEFNPAFGGVLDTWMRWVDLDGSPDDGLSIELRSFELTANAWVDPNTWAYAVLVAEPEEGMELEEAAAIYQGFEGNSSLRAGRFFVDFGKQMQAHQHDLPTFERPAVLREYLGAELGGTGVQYDNWFAAGDSGAIRYSVGVFNSLVAGHGHGEEEGEEGGPAATTEEFKDIDELSLTARLTGFHDVGEKSVFQWGLSLRALPEFTFDADLEDGTELTLEGQSNNVLGVDLTYGWVSDSGTSGWTVGGEYLTYDGDIGASVDDNGTPGVFSDDSIAVLDDDRSGYYLWADRKFSERNSLGLLYSEFEHPEMDAPSDSEATLYYTRNMTEYSRLRFGVQFNESDESGDSTAFLVQFTNFFGSHSHGVNW